MNVPSVSERFTELGYAILTASPQTTDYTVTSADNRKKITYAAGSFTVSLPAVSETLAIASFLIVVENNGAGTITVDPSGSETVQYFGASDTTLAIAAGEKVALLCTGLHWRLVAWE